MAYQAKAKRIDAGHYTLEYGKGSLKLVVEVTLNPSGTWTGVGKGFHATHDKLKGLKEVFARWATSTYGQPRVEATPEDKDVATPAAVVANVSNGWPPGFDPDMEPWTDCGVTYRYYPPPPGQLSGPWCWLDKRGQNRVENRTNAYYGEEDDQG